MCRWFWYRFSVSITKHLDRDEISQDNLPNSLIFQKVFVKILLFKEKSYYARANDPLA